MLSSLPVESELTVPSAPASDECSGALTNQKRLHGGARQAFRIGCAAMLLTYLFLCFFNNLVWEDFLITYRHSKNFLAGHGLVYQPGERVHGFTSPINVAAATVSGACIPDRDPLKAIWIYRAISLVFLLGALWQMALVFQREEPTGVPTWATTFFFLLFAFEFKTVSYSMSGQEPAFTVFFLALAICAVQGGLQRCWGAAGLAWGGLMWSRPEGFIYAGGFLLGSWLWAQHGRRSELLGALKSVLVGAAVYLPWLIGAWIYYGNPIPHTILAKSAMIAPGSPLSLLQHLPSLVPLTMAQVYAPIYGNSGPWPLWIKILSALMIVPALLYWIVPSRDRLGRTASLAATGGFAYLCLISNNGGVAFPWYFPPVAFLGLFILVRFCFLLPSDLPFAVVRQPAVRRVAFAALLLVLCGMAKIFFDDAVIMKVNMQEIELGCRKPVGEWLRAHVRPGERVYLECLGYMGYYSEVKILDYPGLASTEVLKVLREQHANKYTAIRWLKPEWIVLRDFETIEALHNPGLLADYEQAARFNVLPALAQYDQFVMQSLTGDATFRVLHRRTSTAQ